MPSPTSKTTQKPPEESVRREPPPIPAEDRIKGSDGNLHPAAPPSLPSDSRVTKPILPIYQFVYVPAKGTLTEMYPGAHGDALSSTLLRKLRKIGKSQSRAWVSKCSIPKGAKLELNLTWENERASDDEKARLVESALSHFFEQLQADPRFYPTVCFADLTNDGRVQHALTVAPAREEKDLPKLSDLQSLTGTRLPLEEASVKLADLVDAHEEQTHRAVRCLQEFLNTLARKRFDTYEQNSQFVLNLNKFRKIYGLALYLGKRRVNIRCTNPRQDEGSEQTGYFQALTTTKDQDCIYSDKLFPRLSTRVP